MPIRPFKDKLFPVFSAVSIYKFKKYFVLFLIIFLTILTTVIIINRQNLLNISKATYTSKYCLSPNNCQFYEKCISNRCQYNNNWAEDLKPEQALAIYQTLKVDVGIDVPLILDKDRVDKLMDVGISVIAKDDPCALSVYGAMGDSPYSGGLASWSCYNLRGSNEEYKKATDQMTLTAVLQATYPDLSESDIAKLSAVLKNINSKKMPRATLEQILLVSDLYGIPDFIDLGKLGIKYVPKTVKSLPRLLNIIKDGGKFYLSKEGIDSVYAIARTYGRQSIDYASQLAPRLKYYSGQKPAKVIQVGLNKVKLWRSHDIFSPEDNSTFVQMFAKANQVLKEKVGLDFDGTADAWVYFSDRFDLLDPNYATNQPLGIYIPNEHIMVLNISYLSSQSIRDIVLTAIHEKIHYIINKSGMIDSIWNLGKKRQLFHTYYCSTAKFCSSFHEGITELLARAVMQKSGYGWTAFGAYQSQVESVIQLVNSTNNADILFQAIREGGFQSMLARIYKNVNGTFVPWNIDDLKNWIEGLTLIGKIKFLFANLTDDIKRVGIYGIDDVSAKVLESIPYDLLEHDPVVESNLVNNGAYNLIEDLQRITKENNLKEINFDQNLFDVSLISLANIRKRNIYTEDLQLAKNEYGKFKLAETKDYEPEELVEIGKGPKPIFLDSINITPTPTKNYGNYSLPTPTKSYGYYLSPTPKYYIYPTVTYSYTYPSKTPTPTRTYYYPTVTPYKTITPTKTVALNCSIDYIVEVLSGPKYYGNSTRLYVNARTANGIKSKNPDGSVKECYTAVKNCSCQGTITNTWGCDVGEKCNPFVL